MCAFDVSVCTCTGKLAHDPHDDKINKHILSHGALSIKPGMQTSTVSQKAGGCRPVHWVL